MWIAHAFFLLGKPHNWQIKKKYLNTTFAVAVAHEKHNLQAKSRVSSEDCCAQAIQHSKVGNTYKGVFKCMVHVILSQTDVKNCANMKYKIILTNCLSVQNILSMGTGLSVPESFWKLYSKPSEISNPALPICNCILSYTYYIFHIVVTYHVVFLLLYCFLCYVACFLFAQACFVWSQCMHHVLMHCVPS